MIRRFTIAILGLLVVATGSAQRLIESDDSLISVYLERSAMGRQVGQLDSMLYWADQAEVRAHEVDDSLSITHALILKALHSIFIQEMDAAGEYAEKGIRILEDLHRDHPDEFDYAISLAQSYNRAAEIFNLIGNYEKSVEYTFKALEKSEDLHDKWPEKPETIQLMNDVSIKLINQYVTNKKFDLALDQSHKLLDRLNMELEDSLDLSVVLYKLSVVQNMANMYFQIGDSTAGNKYRAIQNELFMEHEGELLNTFGGKGLLGFYANAKMYQKQFDLAYENLQRMLKDPYAKKVEIAGMYLTLSQSAFAMEDPENTVKYGELAYEALHRVQFKSLELMAAEVLSTAYGELGQYKKAYTFMKRKLELEKELEVDQQAGKFANYQYQYEQSKQAEIDSLMKMREEEAYQQEIERQKMQTESERKTAMLYLAGVGVLLVIGGFLVWSTLRSRKTAKMIQEQKSKVDEAYDQLAVKNTEILDSINYAKRIQSAILPTKEHIRQTFKESFVLYKPKDIVAGDFYWLEQFEGSTYFACADCTGHGVPGAMVSVVCSNALSKSLVEERITDPGEILDRTRQIVTDRFGKTDEEIRDGMDVSLVKMEQRNGSGAIIDYAGANNPLWVIRKGATEVEEIKANKQPIGKYAKEEPFNSHSIDLKIDDAIYMFSDGYPDQFGGPKGKKFKSANLKKLLLSIQDQALSKQAEILDTEFEKWRGDIEQIDDVCVVCVRL